MDISREHILHLIKEATMEVGEMAQKPLGSGVDFRPIYKVEGSDEAVLGRLASLKGKEHELKGWLFKDMYPIFWTCDYEEFIAKHKDMLDKLDKMFPGKVGFLNGQLPSCKPRIRPKIAQGLRGGTFETPDMFKQRKYETSRAARTWILDGGNFTNDGEHNTDKGPFQPGLNRLVNGYLADSRMNNHLNKCGIPIILVGDENRNFLNRHGEISNSKIEYGMLNHHLYESAQDFRNVVRLRSGDSAEDIATAGERLQTHHARQYNKIYKRWNPKKQSQDEYKGKTPIYQLDYLGYREINPEITVASIFSIRGALNATNNTYFFTFNFKIKFGEKLKEQFYLDKFNIAQELEVKKTVKYKPIYPFDDNHPVIFNPDIHAGLKAGLQELRNQLFAIQPLTTKDLKPNPEEMMESAINRTTESILKEIKRRAV